MQHITVRQLQKSFHKCSLKSLSNHANEKNERNHNIAITTLQSQHCNQNNNRGRMFFFHEFKSYKVTKHFISVKLIIISLKWLLLSFQSPHFNDYSTYCQKYANAVRETKMYFKEKPTLIRTHYETSWNNQ